MSDTGCPKVVHKPPHHHSAQPLPLCTCQAESRVIMLPGVVLAPDPAELTVARYYVDAPRPTVDAYAWSPESYWFSQAIGGGVAAVHTTTVQTVLVQSLPPHVGGLGPAHRAPEIDATGCVGALTMLLCALAVIRGQTR